MTLYFEESWAILSTIGVANILYGLTVISITKFSPIVLIPIVVSAAGAIANGLCYYAFYSDYPVTNTAIASGFADFFWLIQEVGVSFYSYSILIRLLSRRSRTVFVILFWFVVLAITALRMFILVGRISIILFPNSDYQRIVNYLHVGYFALIALLECLSAFFLLREFASARRATGDAELSGSLLQHLMRGTEMRVASLALIGVSRAVTYIFNQSLPQALTTAGQVDRFIYTLECLFPMMIYIDILACKIKFSDKSTIEMPQRGSTSRSIVRGIWDGVGEEGSCQDLRRAVSTGTMGETYLVAKMSNTATSSSNNDNDGAVKPVEFTMYDDSESDYHGVSYNRTPSLS